MLVFEPHSHQLVNFQVLKDNRLAVQWVEYCRFHPRLQCRPERKFVKKKKIVKKEFNTRTLKLLEKIIQKIKKNRVEFLSVLKLSICKNSKVKTSKKKKISKITYIYYKSIQICFCSWIQICRFSLMLKSCIYGNFLWNFDFQVNEFKFNGKVNF